MGAWVSMLGNMQTPELRLFLRFVTGASICLSPKIIVTFNSAVLTDWNAAHICDFIIELPITYMNYDDFNNDFETILSSTEDEFCRRMDSM